MKNIRNFSIIAHIDHGKSTLADRMIQECGVITARDFQDQLLDNMDIERERGITIKSQTVCLPYTAKDGKEYILNLVDTPGHVDFSYEVSRALTSCEGALLIVDAAQGVEAQTLANLYLAMENDLEIIPVINKIDLPSAEPEKVALQIEEDLGLDADLIQLCSAKTGVGVHEILDSIVEHLPAPEGDAKAPLQALIFDANYDPFRGTIISVRLINGTVKAGDIIRFMSTGIEYKVEEVGLFKVQREARKTLSAGEVGYILAGIKTVQDTRPGETITLKANPCEAALAGFQEVQQVVFSSIYPIDTDDYEDLVVALEKLKLNDAALTFEKDSSVALGFGFRCGFLGLLHLEVVQERLEREFNISLILTVPSVKYIFTLSDGTTKEVDNPAHFPDPTHIDEVKEPFIKASILIPEKYMGAVMNLCMERRGENTTFHYPTPGRIEFICELPLAEVIYDFYDRLKSVTQGYGSFDYELIDYRKSDLVKLDILVNSEPVDALSQLVHRVNARKRGLHSCEMLKEEIPRQMFKIAIQAAIGGNVVARTNISAMRKDVTAKCYGGDISRKRKLLEKQKAGKKRMKTVGNVDIPQTAFLAVLKSEQ
ncbi:translation elongation factor 4 [Desulfotalea psychrophila]|uniref:Elongation factor 4 n=1 Tax=Desulfotalea psychrophila (strain LSv54 / DSM 12343) TaxID=177439 RepID=LEPA_DESPS|nr:translation elongation factor 4 [Desulfotalea psychrophila]Q6AL53.1 RecName: Full=Elongation factor 4; Short=EF-4; AltName: Full=Ribosomal back-translocase LepA [Desulfotalea psychrophila LSv54]CAG36922.1 probable GTP-binding protein (LepA) [Desulfotalea psychrophila LSv54]